MPQFVDSEALSDAFHATRLALRKSYSKIFRAWILVSIGILVTLVVCFGLDALLRRFHSSFPASLLSLALLFIGLVLCEWLLGNQKTKRIVSVIDISAGWSLRWMNIFFTPSFVLLPLSPSIGIVEVMKIIAVFLIGFFVMMVMAAYLTIAIQSLLGSSRRKQTERANEELSDGVPLADQSATPAQQSRAPSISNHGTSSTAEEDAESQVSPSRPQTPPRLRLLDHHHGENVAPVHAVDALVVQPTQTAVPLPRHERWAAVLVSNRDLIGFSLLFLFVGIPVYYATGYTMPLHLTINVLTFFAAISLPARWRTYLHPILVSSLLTVLLIWAFAATTTDTSLTNALHEYRTGLKYIQLWRQKPKPGHPFLPGAGDVLSTLLDASITALALPVFQHRRELRAHWLALLVPNLSLAVASPFAYPPLCYAIGITASRSLAFASRSLTLALATPATENLGGDANTAAALAIISGILGVLCGPWLLSKLGIPEDEYVTRGTTLGINSSALATALLLRTDPRAAAMSCLSMILVGTATVLFTSIPPVANVVRALVGLGAIMK